MAASTSSLAARRAGQIAATPPGHHQAGQTLRFQRRDQRNAEPRTHHDADHRPEDRKDHRLRKDHASDLTADHPDGPQQADLVRAFED